MLQCYRLVTRIPSCQRSFNICQRVTPYTCIYLVCLAGLSGVYGD